MNINKIVIFHEKHGDRIFFAPTTEDLHKIALKIVTERNDEGYWYDYDIENVKEPALNMTQLLNMKDGAIKNAGLQEWKNYEYNLRRNKSLLAEKQLLNRVIKEKNGKLALDFLRMRGGEYEGYDIEEGEKY